MPSFSELKSVFDKQIASSLVWDNSVLPPSMRDKTRGGRTLKRIRHCLRKQKREISEHVAKKQTKAENIKRYREQVQSGEIDYNSGNVDADALYRNQIAMVQGMINGGMNFSEEDF